MYSLLSALLRLVPIIYLRVGEINEIDSIRICTRKVCLPVEERDMLVGSMCDALVTFVTLRPEFPFSGLPFPPKDVARRTQENIQYAL